MSTYFADKVSQLPVISTQQSNFDFSVKRPITLNQRAPESSWVDDFIGN